MPGSNRRLYGLLVAAILVVVGAAVGAVVVVTSGRASGIDLTSAGLVPADAGVYVALNTDLSSSQWVSAFKLAEQLGQKNARNDLKQSSGDLADVNWDKDIAPFLGGDAGIWLRGFDVAGLNGQVGLVIRCKDAGRALAVLQQKATFTEQRHNGESYLASSDQQFYLARRGEHLVASNDEQTLFDALDAKAGRKPSLAGAQDFKTLRDELATNFLAFVYISPAVLTKEIVTDESLRAALKFAGDTLDKPVALELGARANAFEAQGATLRGDGKVAPGMQPRTSRFARQVPEDASVFLSTFGIAQNWKGVAGNRRKELDDAISGQGLYGSLDEALQSAGEQIGLSSLDDVITLLNGETAIAGWTKGGSVDSAQGLLLAEVANEQQAKDVFAKVATAAGGKPTTERAGSAQLNVFQSDSGKLAYAVSDGYLVFGSYDAVKKTLGRQGGTLADSAVYKNTVAAVPTGLGTYVYFDLASLAGLTGQLGTDEQRVLDAIQGVIVNFVDERGVSKFGGVLAVSR